MRWAFMALFMQKVELWTPLVPTLPFGSEREALCRNSEQYQRLRTRITLKKSTLSPRSNQAAFRSFIARPATEWNLIPLGHFRMARGSM